MSNDNLIRNCNIEEFTSTYNLFSNQFVNLKKIPEVELIHSGNHVNYIIRT